MNENKKLEKRVQTITKVNEDLEKRVQRMEEEVNAVKDGIYYAFTFDPPQDLSALDIPKQKKCMDYEDEEDNELENLLNKYQNANKEMTEREKEYNQQKIPDSDKAQLPSRAKALMSAYDKGRELSGSEAGGVMTHWNEYESNHQNFYDPLLEEKKTFEEKKRLCKTAKYELDLYINKMEEEKELAEYRKFYDENGKDEQLRKLLEIYQKIIKMKEGPIKNRIQIYSKFGEGIFLDCANMALKESEELCVTAKNELDAYIKKMEEEKEKPKHSVQLLKDEESKQKMNEDLEKPKHSVQPLKKVQESTQKLKEKWSHSPRKEKNSNGGKGKEKI
ncbi:hypothetical protein niasHT_035805 [Heterodera trifolii]|uniref:Uncharacterized protein n=1 Tax=Heterodera trifolii TaxID=157864 RepID=A0ABD2J2Y3_9BILA